MPRKVLPPRLGLRRWSPGCRGACVGNWMVSRPCFSGHGSPSPSSLTFEGDCGPGSRCSLGSRGISLLEVWLSARSFLSAGDDTALGSEIKEFFVLHGIHAWSRRGVPGHVTFGNENLLFKRSKIVTQFYPHKVIYKKTDVPCEQSRLGDSFQPGRAETVLWAACGG